jgi:excisionase family DNA binding protein
MNTAKNSTKRHPKQQLPEHVDNIQPIAISVEEAAKAAGVGRTLIYEALSKNELASLKAGRRRLIRVEALRAWLRDLEQQTAA